MSWRTIGAGMLVAATGIGVAACQDDGTTPRPETALLSVVPEGGAVGVDPDAPVLVTFDHPMQSRCAELVALHEGDVTGVEVPGTASLEEGGTVLRFVPDRSLKPATVYTIHLGGGMVDADGQPVDFDSHGPGMGGMWADADMMTGGMTGGGMMGGGEAGSPHMGDGWRNPTNGSYGMVFTFTTGS